MTRVVVGLESVLQHRVAYCNREGWQQRAVYCNTLHCTVAGRAARGKVVSQYNLEYCGRRQGYLCRKAGSCVATRRWAEALGARLGAQSGAGGALGRADGRGAQVQGHARQAHSRGVRQVGARQADGTGARQVGARGAGAAGERQQARARAGQGWLGGLGALLANGLCTWCTQPVLCPV